MVLGGQPPGRVGRRRIRVRGPPLKSGPLLHGRENRRANSWSGSSARRRWTRSATGGCVEKSPPSPSSSKGSRRGAAPWPGCRRTTRVRPLDRAAHERIGEPMRETRRAAAARRSAANSRRGDSKPCINGGGDRAEDEEQRPLEPAADRLSSSSVAATTAAVVWTRTSRRSACGRSRGPARPRAPPGGRAASSPVLTAIVWPPPRPADKPAGRHRGSGRAAGAGTRARARALERAT